MPGLIATVAGRTLAPDVVAGRLLADMGLNPVPGLSTAPGRYPVEGLREAVPGRPVPGLLPESENQVKE